MRRLGNQRGQVLVLYTLALTVMFGLVGLAVDLGWMYFREQAAQSAATAAALAAATAAGSSPACASGTVVCQAATACPDPIPSPPTNNIHNACLYARDNGFRTTRGGRQNVTIETGTSTSPPTVPGAKVAYWATARVSETIPLTFLSVLGGSQGTVSVRATAGVLPGGSGGGCVYVLGNGSSVTASGNALLETECGVYVNSPAHPAVTLSGNAIIRATGGASVNIVGTWRGSGNATITPAPNLNVLPAEDPYKDVPEPTVGACDSSGLTLSGWQTASLQPGVYCGAITLSGWSSISLAPGVYVLKGGLTMSGQSTITGTDVMLYNHGGGITMSGGTNVSLTGPTSGTWQGFAIFQKRTNTSSMTLSGGSNQIITGAVYLPKGMLTYSGNGRTGGDTTTLVVNSITFSGNAYIKTPARTQYGGTSGGVALLE